MRTLKTKREHRDATSHMLSMICIELIESCRLCANAKPAVSKRAAGKETTSSSRVRHLANRQAQRYAREERHFKLGTEQYHDDWGNKKEKQKEKNNFVQNLVTSWSLRTVVCYQSRSRTAFVKSFLVKRVAMRKLKKKNPKSRKE